MVSIPKSQHLRIFDLLKTRTALLRDVQMPNITTSSSKKALFKKFSVLNISPIFSLNFFMNYPRYMEVDYVLLEALFIRNPSKEEVLVPFNSEIDSSNRSYYK